MTKRWTIGGAILLAVLLLMTRSVPGQTGFKAPRTADGKPNLNGIWQVLNSAHWNVAPHSPES